MLINIDNYEIYAIDFLEGTLDAGLNHEMHQFLKLNPQVQAELVALNHLPLLESDKSIIFQAKNDLKKEKALSVFWIYRYAIAASLAFLITIVWNINSPVDKNSIAENNPELPIQIEQPQILESQIAAIEESPEKLDKQNKTSSIDSPSQTKISNQIKSSRFIVANIQPEKPIIEINEPPIVNEIIVVQFDQDPELEINQNQKDRTKIAALPQITSTGIMLDMESHPTQIKAEIIAAIPVNETKEKKNSWLLDAITKKADGSDVFAFGAIKKALTPSRYRDANVDKSSIDSPIKQMINDK